MIPNCIQSNATTKCYRSDFRSKIGDAGSVSPGVGRAVRLYKERDDLITSTRLAIDPATARKIARGEGKTDHPARPSLRAGYANNDVSFVMLILSG